MLYAAAQLHAAGALQQPGLPACWREQALLRRSRQPRIGYGKGAYGSSQGGADEHLQMSAYK